MQANCCCWWHLTLAGHYGVALRGLTILAAANGNTSE